MSSPKTHVVPSELAGKPLDAIIRSLENVSWGKARTMIETGKVTVDGSLVTTNERRVRAGVEIVINVRAPRRQATRLDEERIVYVDAHVVVVDKPSGVSTVAYDAAEERTGTLDERVRMYLSKLAASEGGNRAERPTLGVVHRIDKDTSGLVVFTRTWLAKQSLAQQFRFHTVHRVYHAIIHGEITAKTLRSHLIENRGDGLRGSIERMKGRKPKLESGQLAVTHLELEERLQRATMIRCQLETGRTHQIRIHLSEAGHPLVGERVYVREFHSERIAAPRLMLHAGELGFVHPKTEQVVRFESPLPPDFEETLARLR